jgi:peptide/nickel transport system ATP-binding protein
MAEEKKPCLCGSGLTKIYGTGVQKNVAVDHVDFDCCQNVVISIVGESGSGKTTLAKMLLGLTKPTEGEIYFQGKKRDISNMKKKKEYWKRIQAIFQDPYSSLTPSTRSMRCFWIALPCATEKKLRVQRKSKSWRRPVVCQSGV